MILSGLCLERYTMLGQQNTMGYATACTESGYAFEYSLWSVCMYYAGSASRHRSNSRSCTRLVLCQHTLSKRPYYGKARHLHAASRKYSRSSRRIETKRPYIKRIRCGYLIWWLRSKGDIWITKRAAWLHLYPPYLTTFWVHIYEL